MRTRECERIGTEEGRDATADREHVARRGGKPSGQAARYEHVVGDSRPEFAKLVETLIGFAADNECGVDCADRRADDPLRRNSCFVQRLIDADLVSAEGATALEHKYSLTQLGHFAGK